MNEKFPVNVQSINFPDIRNDLDTFVASLPDADQWSQFFESSTGQLISDLIASMSALLKYEVTVARREAYIQFSQNRSSKIGSAQFLGYSVFRGRNAVVELTFTPAGTGVYDKYDIIGTVKDRDLVLLDSYAYNAGVPLTVQCSIGAVSEEIIQAQDQNLAVFRFSTKGVSEDVRIYIDGNEVPTSESVVDMLNGKFQIQSNVYGSVDAKYLNLSSFLRRYLTGSEIKLEWIDLKDIEWATTDIALDEAEGVLTSVEVIDLYKDAETNASIEINAPLTNETKLHVRGRRDQAKIFRQLDPTIIDAQGQDISSAVMKILYVREGDVRFTPDEVTGLQDIFEDYRPHGLLPPIIEGGKRAPIRLKFVIYRDLTATGDPIAKINEVVASNSYKLGHTINLHDIEQKLEAENFIKVARVSFTAGIWEALKQYEVGQQAKVVPDTGLIYEVIDFIYSSGASVPTWPVIAGETVTDRHLVWETVVKSDVTELSGWSAFTRYRLSDTIRPAIENGFAYRVKEIIHITGAVEPTWTPMLGKSAVDFEGTIHKGDGNVMWIARVLTGTPDTWQSETQYAYGELTVPTNPTTSDNVGIMWQVYGFTKPSGASQPSFGSTVDELFFDEEIIWQAKDPNKFEVTLDPTQYYTIKTETTVN